MEITAAITKKKGGEFVLEKVELDEPRSNEVLVKVVATGMCHTDLAVRDQQMPTPLPVVLGHEGAGIVEAVGGDVTKVKPGDRVVMSFGSCGHCPNCQKGFPAYCYYILPLNFGGSRLDGSHSLHQNGKALSSNFFSQSSFGTYALATERNVVKVPQDVPLEILGPLGCGIQTGAGAVMNNLNPDAGSSIAIFGTGAVGLSAIMAANVVGCTTIIAVDINQERLEFSKQFGATHTINSKDQDLGKSLTQIMENGVEFAFDTTGNIHVIVSALESLASKGVCGIVGVTPPDKFVQLDPNLLVGKGLTLRGITEGDSIPDIFIPRLIALYQQGKFPFDKLIKVYPFDQINQAVEDSEKGVTVKPVIKIGDQ